MVKFLVALELQPSPSPTPLSEACDCGELLSVASLLLFFKSFLWWLPVEAVTLLLRWAGWGG